MSMDTLTLRHVAAAVGHLAQLPEAQHRLAEAGAVAKLVRLARSYPHHTPLLPLLTPHGTTSDPPGAARRTHDADTCSATPRSRSAASRGTRGASGRLARAAGCNTDQVRLLALDRPAAARDARGGQPRARPAAQRADRPRGRLAARAGGRALPAHRAPSRLTLAPFRHSAHRLAQTRSGATSNSGAIALHRPHLPPRRR